MSKPLLLSLAVSLLMGVSLGAHINEEGVNLIKSFEGYYANFYKDEVGIRTIGYGHACHSSDCTHIHPPLSKAQAVALLRKDLVEFEHCVEHFAGTTVHLNEHQFAALVSFTYNLGCGSLTHSTLGKDLKKHNFKAAAGQFGLWVHAGGRVYAGLVRRRKAERALFCKAGGC